MNQTFHQYDLFGDQFELEVLRKELNDVRESSHKVRRSIFASHADLAKKYIELLSEVEVLKKHMSGIA